MKICTVIVSYNFAKWIKPCLSSLQNSSIPTDVIVVDNASIDDTCKIIEEDYPWVVLFRNTDNLGFGKANNLGFQYAIANGYNYVFLLNQDAWIDSDTISKLIDVSQRYPHYGILSPVHLNGKGDKLDFGFATYSSLKSIGDIDNVKTEVVDCKFINAAMWLVPVSLLKRVGGFAPIFPHYGEDVDYCHRVLYHNFRIGYVKDALGYHDREFREVSREKYFYSEYIYFLTEATNVNYTFAKAYGYSCLAAIKKSLTSLFSRKVSDSTKYLSIFFKLQFNFKKARQTRLKSIKPDGPFLSDQY